VTRTRLASAILLLVLSATAASGLNKLSSNSGGIDRLPPEHPVAQATQVLDDQTLGDDVLVVVVHSEDGHPQGVLRAGALAPLEAIQSAMEALPGLVEVRSALNVPVLAERDGALTAVTPLRPAPDTVESWATARTLLTEDSFVRASFLGEAATTTALVGWLWSGDLDEWLARNAAFALKDEEFRAGELGRALQAEVNQARLAVAMGDVEGPAGVEIARRLRSLATTDVRAGALLRQWEETAAEPSGEAIAGLQERLTEEQGALRAAGLRAALVGPTVLQTRLQSLYRSSLLRGLAALALFAGLVTWGLRRSVGPSLLAAAAAPVSFVVSMGLFGFLGLAVHPISVSCALLAGWWALTFGTGRAEGAGDDALSFALWTLPLGAGAFSMLGYAGGGTASLAIILVAVLPALALFLPREQRSLPANVLNRRPALVAAGFALAGFSFLFAVGVGVDPSRLLANSEDAGWASTLLDEELGTMPPAFLVADYRGGEPRSLTNPKVVQALSSLEENTLAQLESSMRSIVGWPEFITKIDRGLGGEGGIPDDPATIQQYLLMFHRDEDTRAIASSDLEVAVSVLSLHSGGGPAVAKKAAALARSDGSSGLAGDALEMMLASRLAVQRGVAGVLALLVLFVGLRGTGGESVWHRLGQLSAVLASLVGGLVVAAMVEGVVTPTALLAALAAGGLLAATWSWGDRAALVSLGLGGASALGLLPSPVLGLRAVGLVLLVSCLLAWLFRVLVARQRKSTG